MIQRIKESGEGRSIFSICASFVGPEWTIMLRDVIQASEPPSMSV